jgi:hypothetical protein
MPTPKASDPSGKTPSFGSSARHCVTSAAIERTLASGPMVAAARGMAVDANHHDLIGTDQHLAVREKGMKVANLLGKVIIYSS